MRIPKVSRRKFLLATGAVAAVAVVAPRAAASELPARIMSPVVGVVKALTAPFNTVLPGIAVPPMVGDNLTVSPGTWT